MTSYAPAGLHVCKAFVSQSVRSIMRQTIALMLISALLSSTLVQASPIVSVNRIERSGKEISQSFATILGDEFDQISQRVGAIARISAESVWSFFSPGGSGASGVALVRHAPSVNGQIQGSVRQLTGESLTLNSGATITRDLQVPGTPSVVLNGTPAFGGTIQGTGSSSPTNYSISLNSGSTLGHLDNRIDPITMASVSAPPASTEWSGPDSGCWSDRAYAGKWSQSERLNGRVVATIVAQSAGSVGRRDAE